MGTRIPPVQGRGRDDAGESWVSRSPRVKCKDETAVSLGDPPLLLEGCWSPWIPAHRSQLRKQCLESARPPGLPSHVALSDHTAGGQQPGQDLGPGGRMQGGSVR